MKKSKSLLLAITALLTLSGIGIASFANTSSFMGMLKKPKQGEIPNWCIKTCPSNYYWNNEYLPNGDPVCVAYSDSVSDGQGSGSSNSGSGSSGKTGFKGTPGESIKTPGFKDGLGGTSNAPKQNTKSKIATPIDLKKNTGLKEITKSSFVPGQTEFGSSTIKPIVPNFPLDPIPPKDVSVYECDCTQKSITSLKTGKSFNCSSHFGETLNYTDLDGTKLYVKRPPAYQCEAKKWECPDGYTFDWLKIGKECDTKASELNQKKSQCNGEKPAPDQDLSTGQICTAFYESWFGSWYSNKAANEKYVQSLECVSEEVCKKYAMDKYSKDVIEVASAPSDKQLTGQKNIIRSCLEFFPGLAWPLGGGGG